MSSGGLSLQWIWILHPQHIICSKRQIVQNSMFCKSFRCYSLWALFNPTQFQILPTNDSALENTFFFLHSYTKTQGYGWEPNLCIVNKYVFPCSKRFGSLSSLKMYQKFLKLKKSDKHFSLNSAAVAVLLFGLLRSVPCTDKFACFFRSSCSCD